MAQFGQLGLQERVVPRVVHQADVMLKLAVKSDDKNVLRKGNRMGLEQIASHKWAGAAHGFHQLTPQFS
jgi:hypothetical protein